MTTKSDKGQREEESRREEEGEIKQDKNTERGQGKFSVCNINLTFKSQYHKYIEDHTVQYQ